MYKRSITVRFAKCTLCLRSGNVLAIVVQVHDLTAVNQIVSIIVINLDINYVIGMNMYV